MVGMDFLALLKPHWFDLVQTAGIVSGFVYTSISFSVDSRARRAAFTFDVNEAHREIWSALVADPNLARILDPDADIDRQPVTKEEEHFVLLVLLHLAAVHRAIELRLYPQWSGLANDIRRFFSLPIPKRILDHYLPLQAPEFIRFVLGLLQSRPRKRVDPEEC